jgi:spore maturation protein CgeB
MNVAYHTIPLAADHAIVYPEPAEKFRADISFIGTYLAQKRRFFAEQVFPLSRKYDLRLYGQDWTRLARARSWLQKAGQYFNVPGLRSLQKPSLALEDERRIYASSVVSINIHEDYQRRYGGDCNERTFKIPLAGGFEITDDVACIRKYFRAGEEIVVAENLSDWFEKIDHYIRNPGERLAIIEAGRRRVLAEHTYVHRARRLLEIRDSVRGRG